MERVTAQTIAGVDSDGAVDPATARLLERLVDQKVAERWRAVEMALDQRLPAPDEAVEDRVTLLVLSGDFEKLFAAFTIATGAVAMGMDVSMFFTFWGLGALRKTSIYSGKPVAEKLMAAMLPGGPGRVGISKLNALGLGPAFFRAMMKRHKVQSLPELVALAQEMGVRMIACQMSMDVMGLRRDELLDHLEYGGVATYLADASRSKVTLFF